MIKRQPVVNSCLKFCAHNTNNNKKINSLSDKLFKNK